MDTGFIISIVALGFAVLGVCGAIVSLWIRQAPPELTEVLSKVRQLDLDLTELADRQNTWMRRDAVRNARDGKLVPPTAIPLDPAQVKAELRRRVATMRSGGQL